MSVTIDHSGRVAMVTGAGAGIGREIARWLARAGASVVVTDIRAAHADSVVAEIEAEGGTACAIVADFRDDAAIDTATAEAVERFGGLDICVNNIGMIPPGRRLKPFVEYRGDDWRDIVDQNLTLAALAARAQVEAMLKAGRGGVLFFVTSGETTRPAAGNSIYAAAKASLNHLVASLAVELGPAGIRVLAIAPGTTLTEQVRVVFTDEHMEAVVASTPLRRMVEHDELGRLVVLLSSDLARCVTGQFVLADAGAFLSRTRPASPSSAPAPGPAGSA